MTVVGVEFILENLKSHQKKLSEASRSDKGRGTVLTQLIIPDKVIRDKYAAGVFYEFDPQNSHSTLMVEGLTLKFTNSFFTYDICK